MTSIGRNERARSQCRKVQRGPYPRFADSLAANVASHNFAVCDVNGEK
jgi:hypothetical protein